MAFLRIALLLATVLGTSAHEEIVEHDDITLLQAQLEEKRGAQRVFAAVEPGDEYSLASTLKCASESSEAVAPSHAIVQEKSLVLASTSHTELDVSPTGAGALRMVLQVMILLLVLDCIRCSLLKLKQRPIKKQAEDPALTAAWAQMVKAARTGDTSSFGAFQETLKRCSLLTRSDAWGCSLLHFAAVGGATALVAELLEQGAEVDALDANDETPLHMAARAGHAPICALLHGAKANLNAVNRQGMSPLMIAGHASQEQACRLLFDVGACVAGVPDEELPLLIQSQFVQKLLAAASD